MSTLVSIVIPARNEQDNIGPLEQELGESLDGLPYDFEFIVIDNGSTDGTQAAATTDTVKSLGFAAKPGQTGDGSEWLYAMLILAGVGVLGGHFLFTRFAVASKGA